ncbi:hypothetical protein [Gramella sp. KN1008]|uniref:hypothetical protein n=1 Tax=Gramella sp. KN1008 TaxID=2529298 RepID=UPI00103FBC52|nr:hypothetical protein [Gramella sp. KN1008]TBW27179.1 hypothetical protein EZJ28_12815 [Gramella sp. KN1008]
MDKEKTLIILWIIFGFVFVTAIDSIIYFIIHLMYFGLAELKVSYNVMTYIFPVLTFSIYALIAILVVKKINKNSNKQVLQFDEFPKNLLIILSTVILILYPLTNKFSGLYAEYSSGNTLIEIGEYLTFYGWFNIGFTISQILVLIGLAAYSIVKLKNFKQTNF